MATNDKYSVIVVQNYSNVALANCFFVNVLDDSGTSDTYASLAGEFETAIVDTMKVPQTSDLDYECLLIRKLSPQSEPAQVFPLTQTGSLPGDGMPVNQVAVLNHVSNDGRPPFRGRWFLSGVTESEYTNGRWTATVNTLLATFFGNTIAPFGPANESYQLNHFSDAQDQFDPITRSTLSPIPRKLRNRTPGLCSIS